MLIDAECAWFGDPAFDLAFCLNHFLLKSAHLPAHAGALLASFAAFTRGLLAARALGATAALESARRALLPGLTLARVDGKSPVEYLDEPRREARAPRQHRPAAGAAPFPATIARAGRAAHA